MQHQPCRAVFWGCILNLVLAITTRSLLNTSESNLDSFPSNISSHFASQTYNRSLGDINVEIPDTGGRLTYSLRIQFGKGPPVIQLEHILSSAIFAMNRASLYSKDTGLSYGVVVRGTFGTADIIARNLDRVSRYMNFEAAFYAVRALALWYAENGFGNEVRAWLGRTDPMTRTSHTIGIVELRRNT